MKDMIIAVMASAPRLLEPRILAVLLLPALGSLVLWSVLAWLFWQTWTGAVSSVIGSTVVAGWLQSWSATWVVDYTAMLAVFMALMPAIYVTALVITEVVAMPVIVGLVAERDFPQLQRRHGGSLAGSLCNAAVAITVFALLWIITLPLWLTGIGAVLAPWLNSAYLLQRLLRYDALADHAGAEEYTQIVGGARGDLFLLGILLSLLLYVPVVNLLLPVFAGLVFTRFGLARLERLRKTGGISQ